MSQRGPQGQHHRTWDAGIAGCRGNMMTAATDALSEEKAFMPIQDFVTWSMYGIREKSRWCLFLWQFYTKDKNICLTLMLLVANLANM